MLRQAGIHEAIDSFHQLRSRTPAATYRVRRIMTSKGHGHRCTQLIDQPLSDIIREQNLTPRTFHSDDYTIDTGYARERNDKFPTREEFFVTAPVTVAARARHGIPWFENRWNALDQIPMFN